MLRIVNLEEIQNLLLRIPRLVDGLEQRDPNFVQNVRQWLTVVEEVLVNNRMPLSGNIAALRGTLDATERGAFPPGLTFHGRPTARKIKEATGADVVRRAGELISNALQEDVSRIAEGERLSHQLIALAKSMGLFAGGISDGTSTQKLKDIWNTISADPNVAPGAVRLESLVGQNDALILLDRAITRDTMPGTAN
jgi:hypothetical protein